MHEQDTVDFANVDLVTEALIREHLSKIKLGNTLHAYNSEQPKLAQSISKRSVLQQLLGLEHATHAEVADAKAQSKASTGSSILELWVQQQLSQHGQRNDKPGSTVQTSAKGTSSEPSASPVKASTAAADMSRRTPGTQASVPGAQPSITSSRFGMSGGAAGHIAAGSSQHSALPGHGNSWQPPSLQPQQTSALAAAADSGQQPSAAPAPRPVTAFSAAPKAASQPLQPLRQQRQGPFLGSQGPLQEPEAVGLRAAAASNAASVVLPGTRSGRSSKPLEQQFQNELVLEDLDEDDLGSSYQPSSSTANANNSRPFSQQPAASGPSRLFSSMTSNSSTGGPAVGLSDSQPLSPDQQRQLSVLLWGDAGARPDAAWSQGLIFSTVPGLEWGLVQNAGGPCGVLAAVQAHLIGTLMEQGLWSAQVQPDLLLNALIHSLAIILWTARSADSAQVVMLPQAAAGPAARGLCDAAQITRSAQVISAGSMRQLEVLLKAAMPQYCLRKGWGLLMLLYSLLLTRGCNIIKQDMDDASTCLIDHHGYCSMELVNLMLTGAAVSNVFDGKRQLGAADSGVSSGTPEAAAEDSQLLKGVASQARVGLLTLFEWYKYVEVGQNLKCPKLPVWVVCSESHFTTLALDAVHWQSGASSSGLAAGTSSSLKPGRGAAVLLEFYDGMANAECSIKLTLLPARGGGWSSQLEGVSDDRGTWQGKPIPPLECVVETKWRDVDVIWHGSEPIL